jgi:hypothetical protein
MNLCVGSASSQIAVLNQQVLLPVLVLVFRITKGVFMTSIAVG